MRDSTYWKCLNCNKLFRYEIPYEEHSVKIRIKCIYCGEERAMGCAWIVYKKILRQHTGGIDDILAECPKCELRFQCWTDREFRI